MPQSSKIIFLLVQSLELLVLPVCVRGFFSKHELSIHAKLTTGVNMSVNNGYLCLYVAISWTGEHFSV